MIDRELRLRRAHSQRLDRPLDRASLDRPADAVVHRLLAVQAQDRFAYPHVLRARCAGLTWADVDGAISRDRSLVVGWLNRGTIHLVGREEYPWLLGLTGPTSQSGSARRLAQLGVVADGVERGIACIEQALGDEGPMSRTELRERLRRAGIAAEGQTLLHLLHRGVTRGRIVMGPLRPEGQAFALLEDWLGPDAVAASERIRNGDGRDVALAELARRYLLGHGPASDADLAKWAGLPLRDARAGLRAIASDVVELEGGMMDLAGREPFAMYAGAELPPRLLPAFDASLLGWQSRYTFVPPRHEEAVYSARGGMIVGVFTTDGCVGGTWRIRRAPATKAASVTLQPYEPIEPWAMPGLGAEIADVQRFEQGRAAWREDFGATPAPR